MFSIFIYNCFHIKILLKVILIFTITFLLIDVPTSMLLNKYLKYKPLVGTYILCSIVFYMNLL